MNDMPNTSASAASADSVPVSRGPFGLGHENSGTATEHNSPSQGSEKTTLPQQTDVISREEYLRRRLELLSQENDMFKEILSQSAPFSAIGREIDVASRFADLEGVPVVVEGSDGREITVGTGLRSLRERLSAVFSLLSQASELGGKCICGQCGQGDDKKMTDGEKSEAEDRPHDF